MAFEVDTLDRYRLRACCLMSAEKVGNAQTVSLIWLAVIPNFMAKRKVDQFFAGMAHNVGAKDAIGRFVDNHFGPGGGLVVGPGGEPIAHVVGVNLDLVAKLLGLRFRQSDAGERRNRVDAGGDAGVVGLRDWPFHDVAADDAAFIGRNRGELRRAPENVAARGQPDWTPSADTHRHRYVRRGAGRRQLEIERVDIGDAPGAVDNTIGLERVLGAIVLEGHAQAAIERFDALDRHAGLHLEADPLAFGANLCDRIGIHCRKQAAARAREW